MWRTNDQASGKSDILPSASVSWFSFKVARGGTATNRNFSAAADLRPAVELGILPSGSAGDFNAITQSSALRAARCRPLRQAGCPAATTRSLQPGRTFALTVGPFGGAISPIQFTTSPMKNIVLASLVAVMTSAGIASAATVYDSSDSNCYEMRTYYAAPGKLDDLHARFRNHTCKLFEKHGMVNIGYWVPTENPESKIIYILAYPSREARDQSWKAFMADPEWQAAWKASEANGKLVAKAESVFLNATDYSPAIKPGKTSEPRVFELRTYTASPGKLSNLNARFRHHTVVLFQKHGMTNFAYWTPMKGQKGADDTLIYLLAHKSKDAAGASFKAFREDPNWVKARKASEDEAGGSLTVPDGVKSLFLVPTDYSQTK